MRDEHLYNDDSKRAKEIAALQSRLKDKSLDIEEYLSEDEWKQYLDSNDAGRNNELPDDTYRPVYKASVLKTKRAQNFYKGFGIILLLCICGSAFYFLYRNTLPRPAQMAAYDHLNESKGTERINLPDGTQVLLFANSKIYYADNYNDTSRDIYLEGSAEFQVFKDDRKPLTVYCRNIATTALGTRFRVDGWGENAFVHLYEGKVRVRDTANTVQPAYPLPGEALAYRIDEKRFVAVDINGVPLVKQVVASRMIKKKIALPRKVTDPVNHKTYLNFQNQALSDMFDYLAVQYNVEIRYPTDVALATNMLVSVDAGQPVHLMLQNICRTIGMKVKASGDSLYIISK
ncbi:FecR domain-containing protein [uncultured Chitinophaga sp.]|uniref:FecR domain-containing protein n=1 Tax=uncultured Chitinophaga sp. TaxID=339340 RepID=UPI0025DE9944|nr:FecR domain-containing protein [uncultured Chitinophaga sp.]